MRTCYHKIAPRTKTWAATLADIGGAALALVFICSFAVVFTLNFRPLYYIYMAATGWPDSVGIPVGEIAANYEALIRYNSIFHAAPLDFPTLALSEHGRIHYEEVKRIFSAFEIACYAALAGLVPVSVHMLRRRRTRFLKYGACATLAAVALILAFFATADWGEFFVKFHQTFFSNDYWIFDKAVDPSILILPNGYFLACTVMIFALAVGLAAAAACLSRRLRREPDKPR
jgi:integral membrane protein (TIGR01906 family)